MATKGKGKWWKYYKRVGVVTSKVVSNCSQGTASQLGYAFSAADSLYAPRTPYNCNIHLCINNQFHSIHESHKILIFRILKDKIIRNYLYIHIYTHTNGIDFCGSTWYATRSRDPSDTELENWVEDKGPE